MGQQYGLQASVLEYWSAEVNAVDRHTVNSSEPTICA
jgi:hypothetical protein